MPGLTERLEINEGLSISVLDDRRYETLTKSSKTGDIYRKLTTKIKKAIRLPSYGLARREMIAKDE